MHPFSTGAAAVLASMTWVLGTAALAAGAPDGPPDAAFFARDPGRAWLSGCAFEADRYIVCKHAEAPMLDAIAKPGETTPGAAFQAHMRTLFTGKGCTFEAPPETFRVNGIFLSVDLKNASLIRCAGQSPEPAFRPGVIVLLDTLYFLTGDAPQ